MPVNEICSKVQTANYLCDVYWIKFGLKKKVLCHYFISVVLYFMQFGR